MTSLYLLVTHCVSAQLCSRINAFAVRCLQRKPSGKIHLPQAQKAGQTPLCIDNGSSNDLASFPPFAPLP